MSDKKYLVSEEQVKQALHIDSFRNLSKDKVMEFVSMIPYMDKDVAIAIIDQFPEYTTFARSIVWELNVLCDNVLENNSNSQKDVVLAYKQILNSLDEALKDGNLSFDEKMQITDKMIEVADKVAAKDTENKQYIEKILKWGAGVILGVAALGATILGVSVRSHQIPEIDDDDTDENDDNRKRRS